MTTTEPTNGAELPPSSPVRTPRRRLPIIAAAAAAIVIAFLLGAVTHRSLVSSASADEIESTRSAPVDGGTVSDDPPPNPPDGTNHSFQAQTTNWSVPPDSHAHTFAESCPSGWYVRPGQGSAQAPTERNAAFIEIPSSKYILSEGGSTSGAVIANDPWSIFTAFKQKYTNVGTTDHHEVQLKWWCDKIPDWYTTSSTDASPRIPLGISKGKPSGVDEAGRKTGIGPVPYACFYCSFNFSSLTNASTGLALDWSDAGSGGALTVQNAGGGDQAFYALGQPGGSEFQNGLATFGFWRSDGMDLDYAFSENGDGSVTFTDVSSGMAPDAGRWYFVDQGAGTAIGGVQLINYSTGNCLASSGGAGSAVTTAPCDATDKSQYWLDKS